MAAAGEGGVHGLSTLEFGGLVAFWITFLFFVFTSTWDPFGAPPNRAPAPVRMAVCLAGAVRSLVHPAVVYGLRRHVLIQCMIMFQHILKELAEKAPSS